MLFYTQHNLNWPDLWMCVSRVAARYRLLRSWPRLARGIHRTLFSVSVGRPCDVTRLASWFWHFLIGQLEKSALTHVRLGEVQTLACLTWHFVVLFCQVTLNLLRFSNHILQRERQRNQGIRWFLQGATFKWDAIAQDGCKSFYCKDRDHSIKTKGNLNYTGTSDSSHKQYFTYPLDWWNLHHSHSDVHFFSGWATGMTSSDCVD